MGLFGLFLLWLIIVAMLVGLFAWIIVSNSHYTWTLLKPNQKYMVHGRKYTFPNMDCTGPTYLLRDTTISEMRKLLVFASQALKEMNIDWWLTGGSLMGVEKHGAIPMPFDDDIDIGVDDSHRKRLFSQAFADVVEKYNLQVIYLVGASSKMANRTGACVRLQLVKCHATLDIFFWKRFENDKRVIKLDGWSLLNDAIYNEKEQFLFEDVYPLQKSVEVDDLLVNLPRNPKNLLIQQYGPSVLTQIIARSTAVSHLFPFLVLGAMWTKIPPG